MANTRQPNFETLTVREKEVASLVAEGLSNEEIASRLGISRRTVEVHLYNIAQKLGWTNRSALAVLFKLYLSRRGTTPGEAQPASRPPKSRE